MRNFISSMMLLTLFFTVATSYSQEASTRRFNQNFALQSTASASTPMFHVFTNHKQMNYFFKPAIIAEANAAPIIGSKDFVNQFVVAISGSTAANKTPVISTVQAKNNNLYVYYEEVESLDAEKSAVMAISKDNFKDVVFVDRNSGKQKKIHYADVPPTIAKIVLSYLDMPASESYKNEYQISIDEMGEVIVVKDENGEITNRLDFTVPERTFNNLKASTVNLDNGGEKINRDLVRGKKYREILLLDESNKVVYSLTWDNKNQVNEFTQKFVQMIENIVPEKSISFRRTSETEVAKN